MTFANTKNSFSSSALKLGGKDYIYICKSNMQKALNIISN